MNATETRKSNCIRISMLLGATLLAGLWFIRLAGPGNAVRAQSCNITDPQPLPIPPPPSLPPAGQSFVDPTFCTTIMRVTDAGDGAACHTFYSYWPTFNLDSTRFIYAADEIPQLGHLDSNFHITKGPLYDQGQLFLSTEDAIWSGSNPDVLYAHEGLRLWEYNVSDRTYNPIKDFTGEVDAGAAHLAQMSKSTNNNVFAFSLRGPAPDYERLGYAVWQRSQNTILSSGRPPNFDEVQLDKTGTYLVIKAGYEPLPGVNCRILDLQNPPEYEDLKNGPDDYSPGHSDNGQLTVVGYDNHNNRFTIRNLATPHDPSTVIYLNNWTQANHVSMLADNEGWCLLSNYTVPGDDQNPDLRPFQQEIFQVSTDGNQNVRRLAHHHSVYSAADYYTTPRANISRDGRFVAFTSNWGTSRLDVFIIKVPPVSGCAYSIFPTSQSIGSGGGSDSFAVSANTGCTWTATSDNPSWITITSGASGSGNDNVNYSVSANTGAARNGTITVVGQGFTQSFSISQAGAGSGVQNVIWTNPVHCTVTGNSVHKNGGGDGSCDGSAESQQTITSGNGYLEFTATETNQFRFGALTHETTTNDYHLLDFSIDFTVGHQAEVQENGAWKASVSFASGDVFRIAVESGVVKYYHNGTVFWTSTKTPSFPLYANALLCGLDSTITNAVMLLPSCATIASTSQSFAGNGGTGAISVNGISGCTWTAVSNNSSWITITSGASGSGSGTINYAVAVNADSTIRNGTISVNSLTFTVYQGINFADVPSNDLFYNEIGRLSARGVTLGCGGGNYCPNDAVNRQSMAAFILRSLGEFSPPTPPTRRFNDVPPENVFYNFIDRMAVLNITQGCGGGNYCPADPVTRGQMAAFILRALGEFNPPTPPSQRFNDVPPENVFYNFIDRVAVLQITLGCSANPPLYCPGDPVTRAQMAAFLVRAFNL